MTITVNLEIGKREIENFGSVTFFVGLIATLD